MQFISNGTIVGAINGPAQMAVIPAVVQMGAVLPAPDYRITNAQAQPSGPAAGGGMPSKGATLA